MKEGMKGGLQPSKRGVFFDYQFDPGTSEKQNQKSADNPTCEATGSMTSSYCFRHLGYCNISYMDGHVGDMTFRDKSIFTNSFHDFTKQPSVVDDLGTKLWANNVVQTKYPFGPRPANWRNKENFNMNEKTIDQTFVIYR